MFQDLVNDLKSDLGGHFEDAVVALMFTPTEYDCMELRRAMRVCVMEVQAFFVFSNLMFLSKFYLCMDLQCMVKSCVLGWIECL